MTKLQAEFTKYMKIALKCDTIDFWRAYKAKQKYITISIENIDNLKMANSFNSGIDTNFGDENYSEIENQSLKYAMSKLTDKQKKYLNYMLMDIKQERLLKLLE